MTKPMASRTSRGIVLVAALSLVILYFVPLWSISLDAPQFPEGIGLFIRIDDIEGHNPHDLTNINGLNHYIGMQVIEPDAIPELSFMPWILAGLIGWGVATAALGRRWMICAWFGMLALVAVIGLADFYKWGYDYGHNLDPETAIIKIPGMSYQPPLIGSKQLLNFTALSMPAIGGWIAILVGLVAGWRCVVERGLGRRRAALLSLGACLAVGACDRVPDYTVDHAQVDHTAMQHARTPGHAADAPPPATGSRDFLVVGEGYDFRSVGAAVRAAAPGARIVVRSGLYREPTITVDRPVTIQGEGYPVIDGEHERGLFVVEADGVRITGFELRDVGVAYVEDRAAIRVSGARDCELDHNRIRGGFFAVYLAEATNCRVTDNEIIGSGTTETNSGNGVHVWHSKGIVVEGNTVRGHRDGIYFEFVEQGQVSRNTVSGSIRYGLHFMFSDGGHYEENVFSDNGAGVAVMYTSDITMRRNRFLSNQGSAAFGILLKEIDDSQIIDNLFEENSVGLYAEGFDRTLVRGNRFVRNGRAIRLLSNSSDSRFEANDFLGNTFDVTTNGRRVRSVFEGNYWDEYRGYDRDEDGVGDIPHRPVRLFALVVERAPVTTIMLRSFFSTVLDWTEYVVPSLTPANLADPAPAMRSSAADAPDGRGA